MMFKFDFMGKESKINEKQEETVNNLKWVDAKKIEINNETVLNKLPETFNTHTVGDISIKYILPSQVKLENLDDSINEAEKHHSDLIPSIYEGGLKIWECTYDLINYIHDILDLNGKRILDLGCGTGIVGIVALLKGSYVCFQDYNYEVITNVTIPNVGLNGDLSNCDFFSGDWNSFSDLIKNGPKFQIIFTSETVYNPENYHKLIKIFTENLEENGAVYVAAKTHYFGVGGGLRQFEDTVIKKTRFKILNVWKCKEGVQREILQLNF